VTVGLAAGPCLNEDCPSDAQIPEFFDREDGTTEILLTCILCGATWFLE
jgi:hypothetical protein